MEKEIIIFNGITFIRYPEATGRSRRVYYYPFDEKGNRLPGVGLLHREIWKAHHGDIPKGYDIHHRDENPLNNAIENLECLTKKEHSARHKEKFHEQRSQHFARIRPLTKAWHSSPEGIAWHAQHGKETWENRQPMQYVCTQCGNEFLSLVPRKSPIRFCSRACISKYNEAHRRYYEDRHCEVCGSIFNVKKSKKRTVCSRKCAWVVRRRKGKSDEAETFSHVG